MPGDYKVIIRSDIRNNLVESDEANNLSGSLDAFTANVPGLELGVPVDGSIVGVSDDLSIPLRTLTSSDIGGYELDLGKAAAEIAKTDIL